LEIGFEFNRIWQNSQMAGISGGILRAGVGSFSMAIILTGFNAIFFHKVFFARSFKGSEFNENLSRDHKLQTRKIPLNDCLIFQNQIQMNIKTLLIQQLRASSSRTKGNKYLMALKCLLFAAKSQHSV
jgi:hypothetical protein